jgi:hypothetical protein
MPSSTLKTAPHLGHLIFASLETPAHPKEKTANTTNAKKMLTHFLITIHLLSSINKELLVLIEVILTISILIDYLQKIQHIVKKKSLGVHFSFKTISFGLKNGFPETYFFLDIVFLVVFFSLASFVPHAIFSPSLHPLINVDLFISFNLIFVKSFLTIESFRLTCSSLRSLSSQCYIGVINDQWKY